MLSLFIFLNIVFSLFLAGVNREIARVEQQSARIQQQMETLQEYTLIQERVITVEKILDEALGREPNWHELLLSLGQHFPTGVQLYDMRASYTEAAAEETEAASASQLYLYGRLPDHKVALTWLEQLEAMPQLGEIEHRFILEKGPSGLVSMEFEITAVIQPGEPFGGRKEILSLE